MRVYSLLLLAFVVSGCSKVDVINYQGTQPRFNLFSYFQGQTTGWGMVQNRKGKVLRQFVVHIEGTQADPNTLVLEESFDWRDGEKSKRTWTIERTGEHTFKGSAPDAAGEAMGASYGSAMNWKYYLNVEVGNTMRKIHFNDWMFLQPDHVLINMTEMSKWGIHLGDVTIVFRKTIS